MDLAMVDADLAMWRAPGKVNLYVGKTAVKFNIPEAVQSIARKI
jgi:hypothetical protein